MQTKAYDVIVCGGGPAGIAAAVAAARNGAKTLLIEKNAFVGDFAESDASLCVLPARLSGLAKIAAHHSAVKTSGR